MFEDKRCDVSLGLEPSPRAGSLYVCGIIKGGRNAAAFLGNAAGRRRMRTAWGSVHGIIKTMNGEVARIKGETFARPKRLSFGKCPHTE